MEHRFAPLRGFGYNGGESAANRNLRKNKAQSIRGNPSLAFWNHIDTVPVPPEAPSPQDLECLLVGRKSTGGQTIHYSLRNLLCLVAELTDTFSHIENVAH